LEIYGGKQMKEYLKLIRVKHWLKNGLVFLPLFFSINLFNTEYYRYRSFTGENSICIRNEMTNTNTWFVVMNKLTINNNNLTWNVNKPSNNKWCIQNRYDQNVKWNVGGSTAISGVVSEIIGVKYQ
jgi:hypothetical protein